MKKSNLSPLGKWLIEHDVEQWDFAQRMGRSRGATVYQSQVSQWATGRTPPTAAVVAAIEIVTHGEVRREHWKKWKAKQRRQQVAS